MYNLKDILNLLFFCKYPFDNSREIANFNILCYNKLIKSILSA